MARSLLAIMQLVIDGWWCGLCLLFERGKKKEKSKRPVKKRSSDPISFGVSHFFLFFTVCSLLVKKMEGGKRGICIQQKAPDCSLFCWNVLRPLDLLVGDPGIQSNCNLDWRERACTVYW